MTTETLGGVDDDRPESQGGYDPGVRSCLAIWHKAYPQIPTGNMNDYIEEQGPVQGWCQEIHLFATAATDGRARPEPADLRRGHVQDHRLSRRLLAGLDLRTQQVLWPDRVPSGAAPRQLPTVDPVQDARWIGIPQAGAAGSPCSHSSRCRSVSAPTGSDVASGGRRAVVEDRASSTRSIPGPSPIPTATGSATCGAHRSPRPSRMARR